MPQVHGPWRKASVSIHTCSWVARAKPEGLRLGVIRELIPRDAPFIQVQKQDPWEETSKEREGKGERERLTVWEMESEVEGA